MHIRKAEITSPITTLASENTTRFMPIGALVGIGCLVGAFFLAGGPTPEGLARFSHAYLLNFCFLFTIVLGSLFFVMVQHLTRAGWSVTVRRIAEIIACCMFPMFLLFLPIMIPVVFGFDGLFTWNNSENLDWVAGDSRIFDIKAVYLQSHWFAIRGVVFFIAWIFMAVTLFRWSLRQDETGESGLTARMQAFCAPMMLVFVACLVFASFDWEMSLAPMWFSTMFPVYFFAGSVLSSLAMITLIALLLQRSGRITDEITVEHYHDLAKLMFAFIVFWGYIAFSQFMLIWYANIPEETFWFKFRSTGSWMTVSMILLFGHLFIPFLGLMARTVRRSKKFLLFASIYLLALHWVDHFWLVMPQLNASVYPNGLQNDSTMLLLPALLCLAGMGAIFLASFCLIAGKRSLVPVQDPRLHEALNYDNP